MNTAAKGRRQEHRTMRWLEAMEYVCVRSAASHSAVDVVAWNEVEIRLIQVKSNDGVSAIEREQLQLLRVPPNGRVEVWRWRDRAREPQVEVIQP